MKGSYLIIGIILIIGALLFQNFYNDYAIKTAGESLTTGDSSTYLKLVQNQSTLNIIFWIVLAIGVIFIYQGISKH